MTRLALILLLLALPAFACDRIKAYDGDTLIMPGGERIRVMGVDTPEIKDAGCQAELAAAFVARDFAQAALDRGPVRLERTRLDRYGRTLAVVWIGGDDLAALLIEAGHGREYHGERRRPWCRDGVLVR